MQQSLSLKHVFDLIKLNKLLDCISAFNKEPLGAMLKSLKIM